MADMDYLARPMDTNDIARPDNPASIVNETARVMTQVLPALGHIADKWTSMILAVLCPQPTRFNEIRRWLGCITQKALVDTRKRLERNRLVTRTAQPISME